MMEQRILVFATQNAAAIAVQRITVTMGLSGSTFVYAVPQLLADGRWFIPYPSDSAWLVGAVGYVVAAGTGLVAVGEAPVSNPTSVTNYQIRAALMAMPSLSGTVGRTMFDDMNDAIKLRGGLLLQSWEHANDLDRTGSLIATLITVLGMTSAKADALFVTASKLKA